MAKSAKWLFLLAAPLLMGTVREPNIPTTCAANNWVSSIAVGTGAGTCTQPACGSLSNGGNGCQASDTTGTWTPTITGSGGGSATYNFQIGNYIAHTTSSGQTWVTAQCYVSWATTSGLSGNFEIAGLPLNSINVANTFWLVAAGQYTGITMGANYVQVGVQLPPNTSTMQIVESASNGSGALNIGVAGVASAGAMLFTIIYRSA